MCPLFRGSIFPSRPLKIVTQEFGKTWGTFTYEKKLKLPSPSSVKSPAQFMEVMKTKFNFHPVEIIGKIVGCGLSKIRGVVYTVTFYTLLSYHDNARRVWQKKKKKKKKKKKIMHCHGIGSCCHGNGSHLICVIDNQQSSWHCQFFGNGSQCVSLITNNCHGIVSHCHGNVSMCH